LIIYQYSENIRSRKRIWFKRYSSIPWITKLMPFRFEAPMENVETMHSLKTVQYIPANLLKISNDGLAMNDMNKNIHLIVFNQITQDFLWLYFFLVCEDMKIRAQLRCHIYSIYSMLWIRYQRRDRRQIYLSYDATISQTHFCLYFFFVLFAKIWKYDHIYGAIHIVKIVWYEYAMNKHFISVVWFVF
jgi:hypothetical protein